MENKYDVAAFQRRLKIVVKLKDANKETLANKCGLPKPTFESYIYGSNLPSITGLAGLCVGLGVSADYLMFGKLAATVGNKNEPVLLDVNELMTAMRQAVDQTKSGDQSTMRKRELKS